MLQKHNPAAQFPFAPFLEYPTHQLTTPSCQFNALTPSPGRAAVKMAFLANKSVLRSGSVAACRPNAQRSVKVMATSRVDRYSKNDIIVSPSILSANFAKLGEEVSAALTCLLGRL